MSEGIGFGKTILFGEHFVVYGLPAIAASLDLKTIATIKDSENFQFHDERPQTPGYKQKKETEIQRQLESLKSQFLLNEKNPVSITLSGDLTCNSGVGASAALAASISRALNAHFKMELSDEQINQVAYLAEEAGSGTPSGIDNTCSVFGGFLIFEKNLVGGQNKIEKIKVDQPLDIVLASSGITQQTKEVVGDVKRLKDEDPKKYEKIFNSYLTLYTVSKKALDTGNLKALGNLMIENQKLLEEMTLSCPEIDEIIKTAMAAGAYGAKLTGTGRGGSVIILTPGLELQEKVSKAIDEQGYSNFKTKIGV